MTGEGTVRLRPPNNTLSERAIGWWRTQWLVAAFVPVAVLGVLAASIAPARTWLLVAAVAVAVIGVAGAVLFPGWWYRLHRWEVTGEAVYIRTGAFWQEWRIAPMSRIQTVDTVRGPLERAFGLSTVTVTTASSKGALRIEGLDHELAAELSAQLTRVTQATPGDAT
ncbi:PH domain-containing protein [Streptomyces sp. SCSIO 30461]|uniref:PH domain-containing protein n=1 Tax=Streptomyces sp. SCSIO 30461 TaxID=3118085 RepID=UPI0030CD5BD4